MLKAQTQQKTRKKSDENEEDMTIVLQDIPIVPKKERKCCFKWLLFVEFEGRIVYKWISQAQHNIHLSIKKKYL